MRIPRTVRIATVSVLAAGTVALGVVQSASAAPAPVSEHYAARAGAQVAELSLLGRTTTFGSAVTDSSLEAISQQLTATATGMGTDLSPTTRSVARFRDPGAAGGTNCATPPVGAALDGARSMLKGADSVLPAVEVAPACGTSSVTGTPSAFTAESTGGRTQMGVKLPDALQSLVGEATGQLAPKTLATPLGDLVEMSTPANAEATQAVGTLNGVLSRIAPGVALPAMEPHQTVGTLLQRLQSGDLLHIDLASASARNAGDATAYVAEALSQGGVIDVLPGFRGQGSAPLLRMTIARSRAAVPVDRASTTAAPVVENAVVRIESDLLGGGLPLDRLVSGLGLRSGAGYIEVGPGQRVSVLCDGPVAPLCSEISVGAARSPVSLPNGATHAESSTVTVHLFKGLDSLAPGTHLGTALAQPAVMKALAASAPTGMTMGDATGIPGIRLVSGGVVAEAGGARVLGAETAKPEAPAPASAPTPAPAPNPASAPPAPVRNLPHTGGEPFSPAAAPSLLCSSVALGSLTRRRSEEER